MTVTIDHKLLMLTNGNILDKGEDHYILRQCLVSQVFSKLSKPEQDAFFDVSLHADVMRMLRQAEGSQKFSNQALEAMGRMSVKHFKEEHLLKSSSQGKQTSSSDDDGFGGWEPH